MIGGVLLVVAPMLSVPIGQVMTSAATAQTTGVPAQQAIAMPGTDLSRTIAPQLVESSAALPPSVAKVTVRRGAQTRVEAVPLTASDAQRHGARSR